MNLELDFRESLRETHAGDVVRSLQDFKTLPTHEEELLQDYRVALIQEHPDPKATKTLRRHLIERYGRERWRDVYDEWLKVPKALLPSPDTLQ